MALSKNAQTVILIEQKTRNVRLVSHVRKFRELCNISQESLATLCGVSRQTIISAEKLDRFPSVLTAFKIAAVLNISVGELFLLEETGKHE